MKDRNKLENIMKLLLEKAVECSSNGEIPVAAAVIDNDLNMVSLCGNDRQSTYNVLGHAEVLAIQKAEEYIKDWRLDGYSMIVTLKPCEMCRAVIKECRLDRVYYLAERNSSEQINDNIIVKLDGFENYAVKSSDLLTSFFDNMR